VTIVHALQPEGCQWCASWSGLFMAKSVLDMRTNW